MSINEEQQSKAPLLIIVTESGIVICWRDEQDCYWFAIFFNDLYYWKANPFIRVTEEGIKIFSNLEQKWNA